MSLIWLEVVLGFGVPLGWGFWQLYTLRRDKRLAAQREAQQALARARGSPATPPDGPG